MTAVMLVTTLPIATATTASPYLVTVVVEMSPSGTQTPVGLEVQFTNLATSQSCTGSTASGGTVLFSSATCPGLTAGWWRASLSPQKITISSSNVWMVTPPNSTGVNVALGQPTGTAVPVYLTGVTMAAAAASVTGYIFPSSTMSAVPGSTYHLELLDPRFPGYVVSSTNITAPPQIVTQSAIGRNLGAQPTSPLSTTLKLNFAVSGSCQISFTGNTYTNGQSASVVSGTMYAIVAESCPGYIFSTWATNAGSVSSPTSSHTNITVTNNGTLYANYTASQASFTLNNVPAGMWPLYTYGTTNTSTGYDRYNYTSVSVSKKVNWQNVTLENYLIFGSILTPSGTLNNGTNVTLWDVKTHSAYQTYVPGGLSNTGYYQAGLYPNGMGATGGNETFVAFVASQGYSSAWHNETVNNSVQSVQFDPMVTAATPSTFFTNITFSSISNVSVSSKSNLGVDATFPQLPNATVANLWAQLGLDFNGSVPGVNLAAYKAFQKWLGTAGPIYPAQSEGLAVNGTGFQDNGAFTLSWGSYAFPGNAYYYSTRGMSYQTSRNYQLPTTIARNSSEYQIAVGFNYPTSAQSLNYTVNLPSGYVLRNGTTAPSGTTLIPAGPVGPSGKLWTSFTILPHTYGAMHGMGNFTIYRVSNVTAVVNVTSSNFAFSTKNLLNQTRGNYTFIVGAGQNDSFTASHSLVPPTMNVTNYAWRFTPSLSAPCVNTSSWSYLKAQCVDTTAPTIHHIYTQGGEFNGTLTLLSSGGNSSTTSFTAYADSAPPVPTISLNNTHVGVLSPTESYLYVNWSTLLKLNATGTTDAIGGSVTRSQQPGIISVANWTIQAGATHHWTNYSLSSGSKVFNNLTYQFNGAGSYVKDHVILPGNHNLSLKGWEYSVTLTTWDAGGNRANTTLYVLVNDTEKPKAVATLQDSNGHNITGGLVEQKNGTAQIRLLSNYSYDPHNGSLTSYSWSVTNHAGANISTCYTNSTKKCYWNSTSPTPWTLYLQPSTSQYNFSLNVTDLAGNHGNASYPVTIAQNLTVRPIITVGNITAPSTMTDGSGYTIWVNVNNTGFKTAVAYNVSVRFYVTDANGNGETVIGGSPGSVHWYGYTGSVVNSTSTYTGVLGTLKANQSWRAQISYTPPSGFTGTKEVWANATATNEFSGEYRSKANVAQTTVTINPNPLTQYLEYAAIGVAAVVVILLVVFFWRRKSRGPVTTSKKDKDKKSSKDDKKDEKKSDKKGDTEESE